MRLATAPITRWWATGEAAPAFPMWSWNPQDLLRTGVRPAGVGRSARQRCWRDSLGGSTAPDRAQTKPFQARTR